MVRMKLIVSSKRLYLYSYTCQNWYISSHITKGNAVVAPKVLAQLYKNHSYFNGLKNSAFSKFCRRSEPILNGGELLRAVVGKVSTIHI